jgi:mannosyltransferase OCH1-like enzyme
MQTIHQIWIQGPEEFQKNNKFYQWSLLWSQYYPHWKYKLWSENDLLPLLTEYGLLEIYQAAPNFACKSDILRYLILSKEGGLYVDTDYEPFRNAEWVFHDIDLVLVRMERNKSKQLMGFAQYNNAFIYAGIKHHPLFRACLDLIKHKGIFDPKIQSSFDYTMSTTGPHAWMTHIQNLKLEDNSRVRILPHSLVEIIDFPNWWLSDVSKDKLINMYPFAIGCHHLQGEWSLPFHIFFKNCLSQIYFYTTDNDDFVMIGLSILVVLLIFVLVLCIVLCIRRKK